MKKGIKAGRRISASRIPRFRRVALSATQSEKGPAVTRPIVPPTKKAKLLYPTAPEKL